VVGEYLTAPRAVEGRAASSRVRDWRWVQTEK
jgi:hypothetical protein